MNLTTMIFSITINLVCIIMATIATVVSCFALAKVYGMEKSTHRIIQGPWSQVPTANDDVDNEIINTDEDPQDIPIQKKKKAPMTLAQQMKEFMYPDVDREQV